MDAYDRCTNLGKKNLPILLPSVVEAENFSDLPRNIQNVLCGSQNKQRLFPYTTLTDWFL